MQPITLPLVVRIVPFAILLTFAAPELLAADGTWITAGGGNWSTAGNWSGGTIANGSGFTANFNSVNIPTGNNSIDLGGNRTIGNLTFGDTTPTVGARWNILAGYTLTLAGGTPTITVNELGDGVNSTVDLLANLAGTSGLQKAGIGTLNLSGNNNGLTGGFTVTGGVLRSAVADAVNGSVDVSAGAIWRLVVDNTTTTVNGLSGSGIVEAAGSGIRILTLGNGNATSTFSGIIQSNNDANQTMTLTKVGSGTLTLSGGSSTYKGVTTISGGTLSASTLADGGSNSSIGASTNAASNLILNGGTLQYTGGAVSTNRLFAVGASSGTLDASGSGAVNFTNTGSMGFSGAGIRTLTLTGSNLGNNTLAAVIANQSGNATSLTKDGAGRWVLTGVNTYTGSTTVSAGTLVLSGSGSIANSAIVNVQSGATLSTSGVTFGTGQTIKGGGTIAGNTTLQGTLAPGNSPGILTFSNNLTLASTTNSVFEIQNTGLVRGTDYDGVNVTSLLTYDGTLTLTLTSLVAGGTYNLFDFGSFGGNFTTVAFSGGVYAGTFTHTAGIWSTTDTNGSGQTFSFALANGELIVSAIPEPSTTLLLTGGLMALLLRRRRRA